jgi:hypothetical protein
MRRAALALGLLLALSPAPARADLSSDVERLTLAWSAFGRVKRLPPRLLERGDVVPLLLPADATDPTTRGCVTVAVLSPTSVNFVTDFYGLPPDQAELPESSLAGAVVLSRCGAKKSILDHVAVELRSPRGLIEVLLVTSEAPLPALTRILPHRDPGPLAPQAASGPRPSAAPLPLRLKALQEHAAQEGAVEVSSEELVATVRGNGQQLLALPPGCHRLSLLADEAGHQSIRAVDLDLEVSHAQSGEVLAADRSEGTDASVEFCTGRPVPVNVRYAGALPRGRTRLVRTRFELERRLPAAWDAEARAQFSAVLRRYRVKLDAAGLVDAALGVQGSTMMPFQPEPGACYVAAVVRLRGSSYGLSLAATVGASFSQNRASDDTPGTALSFCATSADTARLDVDSRGLGLVWMAALFQTGRIELGEGSP